MWRGDGGVAATTCEREQGDVDEAIAVVRRLADASDGEAASSSWFWRHHRLPPS